MKIIAIILSLVGSQAIAGAVYDRLSQASQSYSHQIEKKKTRSEKENIRRNTFDRASSELRAAADAQKKAMSPPLVSDTEIKRRIEQANQIAEGELKEKYLTANPSSLSKNTQSLAPSRAKSRAPSSTGVYHSGKRQRRRSSSSSNSQTVDGSEVPRFIEFK